MDDAQKAAYIMAQAACAMAMVAGMFSENLERSRRHEGLKYGDVDFEAVINGLGIHHNAVLTLFGG